MNEQKKMPDALDCINPFHRPSKGLPEPYQTKGRDDDKYIIERAVVDKVVKTGEKDTDYILKPELVEISRKNRADFINSFREDVGILNIVKKVQLTGDATLLNQRQVEIGYADITDLPKDKIEAMQAVQAGVDAFDELPDEIKKKMSFKQFAEQNKDEYDALIADIVEKVKNSQESQKKGEGE